MHRAPLASGTTSSWLPMLPPIDTSFWEGERLRNHIRNVQDTIDLLKAVQKELKMVLLAKGSNDLLKEVDNTSSQSSENNLGSSLIVSEVPDEVPDVYQSSINGHRAVGILLEMVKAKSINLSMQESLSLEAANSLLSILKSQLALFNSIANENGSWEEKSAAVKLVNKLLKSKRNKTWRKKRRKQVAEMLCKKHEMYEQADKDADEWRAREIAKDIAKHKVEKMKAIAKDKAKEDRKKLEFELELVLIVEKLKELRSIRIQKLKKQGHFLPEEDDKFLERVRAAVEEEERYAAAAADTDAAKDAIATAEESRKTVQATRPNTKDGTNDRSEATKDYLTGAENGQTSCGASNPDSEQKGSEGQSGGGYDSVGNLPVEFYHYYHGSNTDMGTLIEVRRTWDAFIRPGGSRIPGHWIQPPPPSNDIWASYLVTPKE